MNKFKDDIEYGIVRSNDQNFLDVCDYIKENIVNENLFENGGMLQNSDIIYKALFLIVAYKDGEIIAFNSIRQKNEEELYISQVVVKEKYRKLGIGSNLVKMAIQIAKNNNKNVRAHAREYNEPSIEMFRSLGFEQSDKLTKRGSYTFKLKLFELDEENKLHK